jgi:hypothetical protein
MPFRVAGLNRLISHAKGREEREEAGGGLGTFAFFAFLRVIQCSASGAQAGATEDAQNCWAIVIRSAA